ncbi:MAG: hypothetical protein ABEH58_08195 [Haloplanus sp.]
MPPALHDHVRPVDADAPAGVYRVVGVGDGTVTLLRVTDADGNRRHTGRTITVDAETFADFLPVDPPTRSPSAVEATASALELTYWSIRAFARELATRPLMTAVSLALILFGFVGDGAVSLPDPVFGGLILVGSLVLASIGSGRL